MLEAAARNVVPVVVGSVLVAGAALTRLPELDRPCGTRHAVRPLARTQHVGPLESLDADDAPAFPHPDLGRRVRDERALEARDAPRQEPGERGDAPARHHLRACELVEWSRVLDLVERELHDDFARAARRAKARE